MEGGKGRGEVLREGVVKDESEERRNGLILPAPLFLQYSNHLIKSENFNLRMKELKQQVLITKSKIFKKLI